MTVIEFPRRTEPRPEAARPSLPITFTTEPDSLSKILAYDAEGLVDRCLPGPPPHWREPSGSDPFELFDVRQANAALARGKVTVREAALYIAQRALSRLYGGYRMAEARRLLNVKR